jgi:DNA-binding HxlR family transcriptional regulator
MSVASRQTTQDTVPQPEESGELFCPASAAMELLQEKWVLFIVRALLNGSKGFNELRRDVGNCNPSTLSERLDNLERHGIIIKTVHSMMPPRTGYELTDAGFALQSVIEGIDAWARQHLKASPLERV